MVTLSFSVKQGKLLDGSKRQTLRIHNPKRIAQMKEYGLQIWWKQRSPQNGRFLFPGVLMPFPDINIAHIGLYGIVPVVRFVRQDKKHTPVALQQGVVHHNGDEIVIRNFELNELPWIWREKIARWDGFNDFSELLSVLESKYGTDLYDVYFDVITFDETDDCCLGCRFNTVWKDETCLKARKEGNPIDGCRCWKCHFFTAGTGGNHCLKGRW